MHVRRQRTPDSPLDPLRRRCAPPLLTGFARLVRAGKTVVRGECVDRHGAEFVIGMLRKT